MSRFPVFLRRRSRPYAGSVLLASSLARVSRILLAVGFLWGLTGWAMGWWWDTPL